VPETAENLKWKIDSAGKAVTAGKLCAESLFEFPALTNNKKDPNYTNTPKLTNAFYAGQA